MMYRKQLLCIPVAAWGNYEDSHIFKGFVRIKFRHAEILIMFALKHAMCDIENSAMNALCFNWYLVNQENKDIEGNKCKNAYVNQNICMITKTVFEILYGSCSEGIGSYHCLVIMAWCTIIRMKMSVAREGLGAN